MGHAHQHSAGHGRHHEHEAGHGQAVVLDWDAHVLAEVNADIIEQLPLPTPPRHIIDLGCGTGTGTFALLDRFPDAVVTAVDSSAEHLERLRDRATDRGLHDRVRTVQADLDAADWPELVAAELIWASASLHHLADPLSMLRRLHDVLAPGGLLAVIELAGLPRFLPEDQPADRPGLEERLHAAGEQDFAGRMPHRGADWGPTLSAAGFVVEQERTISVHIAASADTGVGAYALAALQGLRSSVADRLSPVDRDALDRLVDVDSPDNVTARTDLVLRTERRVWAARAADGRSPAGATRRAT